MKEIYQNILKSFNTKREGFSSRKLTAFVIILLVIIVHIKWITLGDLNDIGTVLTIDYGFVAALFGMTTYHSIKTNGGKDDTNNSESETPSNDMPTGEDPKE
jgi:hypothetical protein